MTVDFCLKLRAFKSPAVTKHRRSERLSSKKAAVLQSQSFHTYNTLLPTRI